MLRPAISVRGASAAEMFSHPDRFTRIGAMPPTTLRLLQDKGSVQLQDGDDHRHRKTMVMAMMTSGRVESIGSIADDEWRRKLST
jgi:fatty-acid peroxygenase